MDSFQASEVLTQEKEIDIGVIRKFMEQLPEKALHLGSRVLLAVVFLIIGIQLIRIFRKIIKKSLLKGSVDAGAVHFIDSFIKAALYIILIFTIASGFGLDAASIVAVLGSAGVAIGLAIQGSLSNFAGGVLILLLKPFKVGDYIKESAHGNEGIVIQIELFYTKLAAVDGKVIVLPNGALANTSLINTTACDSRRMDITVGISYDADIRTAKDILIKVLQDDEAVMKDKEHLAYVNELQENAVSLGIRCWFSQDDYWEGKWRITENVKYALDEAQIKIPYPQIEVYMQAQTVVEKQKSEYGL